MTRYRQLTAQVILLFLSWKVLLIPAWALDKTALPDSSPRMWRLAEQEQAILEQQNRLFDDVAVNDYLAQVAGRLWKQLDTDLQSPVVKIIMDPFPNAQAYPNGYCLVTTGMLSHLESEEQFAMILAHEMIHYARQHTPILYEKVKNGAGDLDPADSHIRPTAKGEVATAATIHALEKQADAEGLALFETAGYCLPFLLEQISAREDDLHGNGSSAVLKNLKDRLIKMRPHAGMEDKMKCRTPVRGLDRKIFLRRICPVLLANAQVALARGDLSQADRSVSIYLAMVPDDARANFLKGEILNRNNAVNKDAGLSFYEKALAVDPNFPSAHRALGVLYFKAGNYEEAMPHLQTFLALVPDDPSRLFIEGYLRQCQK